MTPTEGKREVKEKKREGKRKRMGKGGWQTQTQGTQNTLMTERKEKLHNVSTEKRKRRKRIGRKATANE